MPIAGKVVVGLTTVALVFGHPQQWLSAALSKLSLPRVPETPAQQDARSIVLATEFRARHVAQLRIATYVEALAQEAATLREQIQQNPQFAQRPGVDVFRQSIETLQLPEGGLRFDTTSQVAGKAAEFLRIVDGASQELLSDDRNGLRMLGYDRFVDLREALRATYGTYGAAAQLNK